MNDLKIGVIGCGQIATVAHVPLLAKMRGVQIAALADPNPAAIAQCRAIVPGAATYTDARDLIAAGSIDAVVISSPSHAHAGPAIAAFDAGMHVYLEKPVASSLSDAIAITEAWRRSGKIGAIGHSYRFNPLFARLKAFTDEGRIGTPTTAECVFHTPAHAGDTWRRSRSSGGGALLDLSTHHIDLLRYILQSEVSSVSAKIESIESEHDAAMMDVAFASGATAHLECAFGRDFADRVKVSGTGGSLFVDVARTLDVERVRNSGRSRAFVRFLRRFPSPRRVRHLAAKLRSPFHEPSFAIALSSFVESVRTGVHYSPDLDDGFAALAVVLAAERSAASGMTVAVTMGDRL